MWIMDFQLLVFNSTDILSIGTGSFLAFCHFENLSLGKNNELKNRDLYIKELFENNN